MSLFNKTIRSNSKQKDTRLQPIKLRASSKIVFDQLKTFLKENNFSNISSSPEFHEIYAKKSGFEYTFMVFVETTSTVLSVMIYAEDKLFVKKKYLLEILNDLRIAFEKSIY